MNTQNVISVNPTGKPEGLELQREITGKRVIKDKSVEAMKRTVRSLLGVSSHAGDSRRQWSFRVILGTILMCFGMMYLNKNVFAADEHVYGLVSISMIAGGALISCGVLTRLVALLTGVLLATAISGVHIGGMIGYSVMVSIGVCVAAVITGSGRYSIDTLIYNWFVGRRLRSREADAS